MKIVCNAILAGILVFLVSAFLPHKADAMQFEIGLMHGREVLFASGTVESGDAKRYKVALEQTKIQPHGARVVVLDSPGGSVSAALRMSKVNEDFDVHMFIPDGAICASACASILFISGDYRTMSVDGLFGQHSCSRDGTPNPECNEEIAMHAVEHGVPHGAVSAFVTYVLPEEILWFSDTDLDCHAISRFPFSRTSGFELSLPCFTKALKGSKPPAQSVWRVEMKTDGYRAFARVGADDMREFELGLYCDESRPGQLFLEFDITGPAAAIRLAIAKGYVIFGQRNLVELPYSVEQIDRGYSRITFVIPTKLVRDVLTKADPLGVFFDVVPGFEPIGSWADTSTSREALLFVANHCTNRLAVQRQ